MCRWEPFYIYDNVLLYIAVGILSIMHIPRTLISILVLLSATLEMDPPNRMSISFWV